MIMLMAPPPKSLPPQKKKNTQHVHTQNNYLFLIPLPIRYTYTQIFLPPETFT